LFACVASMGVGQSGSFVEGACTLGSFHGLLEQGPQAEPFHILCYGDSLTAGYYTDGQKVKFKPYGATLKDCLQSLGIACRVSICGLSGHTAKRMVDELDEETVIDACDLGGTGLHHILREDGPHDLVLLMAGTNDIGRGYATQQILGHLGGLHAACHRHAVPTVALAPPSPVEEPTRNMRRAMAHWVQTKPEIFAFIDPEELVPRTARELWDRDSLHLSPVGSQMLGNRLVSRILPVLQHLGVEEAHRAAIEWTKELNRKASVDSKEASASQNQKRRMVAAGGA